ncbi:hypothetical protein BC938DRAFT_475792, partial [Jimgerdemannia flammicorona]
KRTVSRARKRNRRVNPGTWSVLSHNITSKTCLYQLQVTSRSAGIPSLCSSPATSRHGHLQLETEEPATRHQELARLRRWQHTREYHRPARTVSAAHKPNRQLEQQHSKTDCDSTIQSYRWKTVQGRREPKTANEEDTLSCFYYSNAVECMGVECYSEIPTLSHLSAGSASHIFSCVLCRYMLPGDDEELDRLLIAHYAVRYVFLPFSKLSILIQCRFESNNTNSDLLFARIVVDAHYNYKFQSTHQKRIGEWNQRLGRWVRIGPPLHSCCTIAKKLRKFILNVGHIWVRNSCGPGSWTLEMATDFPNSDFCGIDIAEVFPAAIVPRNVKFQKVDVLKGLPFGDNTFDYVYQRYSFILFSVYPSLVPWMSMNMSYSEKEWPNMIKELLRVTKPGGWIELGKPLQATRANTRYSGEIVF